MTWIRFDEGEKPVALPVLFDRDGGEVRLESRRGREGLVLLLCPDLAGSLCALAEWQIARQIDGIVQEDAYAFAVYPAPRAGVLPQAQLPALGDSSGRFRDALAGLLEFDTAGAPLLFILDDEGRPVAAHLGPANPQEDLGTEAVERLRRAAMRCPE